MKTRQVPVRVFDRNETRNDRVSLSFNFFVLYSKTVSKTYETLTSIFCLRSHSGVHLLVLVRNYPGVHRPLGDWRRTSGWKNYLANRISAEVL